MGKKDERTCIDSTRKGEIWKTRRKSGKKVWEGGDLGRKDTKKSRKDRRKGKEK